MDSATIKSSQVNDPIESERNFINPVQEEEKHVKQ